jgi:large subunit ribosomal protein L25
MQRDVLVARPRATTGKKVSQLRRQGILPAVVYGPGVGSVPIELDARQAARVLTGLGGASLIDLQVGQETHKVLVREVQRDAIRLDLLHVDFLQVAMDRPIRAAVPVELVGTSPAVRTLGGVLVTGLSEIEVEALPSDLPERVAVDLEQLAQIDDAVSVGDLYLGKGVKLLTDAAEVLARVIYQAEPVEEVAEEVPAAATEPELVERRRKEELEEEAEKEKKEAE